MQRWEKYSYSALDVEDFIFFVYARSENLMLDCFGVKTTIIGVTENDGAARSLVCPRLRFWQRKTFSAVRFQFHITCL